MLIIKHTRDNSTSDFEAVVFKNSLYIGNTSNGKGTWVKIGYKTKDFITFSNTTNAVDQFRAFKSINTGNYSYKRIMETLELNHDEDIRVQLLGRYGQGYTVQDVFNHLKTVIGLKPENGKKSVQHNQEMYGWGLNTQAIRKHAKFGKNIILLDQLCHKNIFSIKDKNMHSVEHLPNAKVSDSTGVGKLSETPAHAKLQVLLRTNVVLRGRLQVQSTAPAGQASAGAWRSEMTPVFDRIRMRIQCRNVPAGFQVITSNLAPRPSTLKCQCSSRTHGNGKSCRLSNLHAGGSACKIKLFQRGCRIRCRLVDARCKTALITTKRMFTCTRGMHVMSRWHAKDKDI